MKMKSRFIDPAAKGEAKTGEAKAGESKPADNAKAEGKPEVKVEGKPAETSGSHH